MTLQELDEVLRVWKVRLASIAENLLDLQSDTTYRSLTGTGGMEQVTVTGVTAARLRPVLGAMNTMFEQFGLLQATIDQAEKLRAGLPAFFGGEAKARELQQLLFGRSIQLSTVNIPMDQRTLLGGIRSSECMAPEELLEPMTRTFSAARDTVLSIDRAWTEFADKSGAVEAELERLRGQRAMPTALLAPSLAAVEAKLEAVRAHVQTDPLGAEGDLRAQVEPALAEVARRIGVADQVGQQLRAARERLEEFLRLHRDADDAVQDARDKVAEGTSLLPLSAEATVQGIQDWLARLEHKRQEGALEAVQVGLRHWNAAVDTCVLQDGKVGDTARARMEQRGELRGRMDALKAKARRYGVAETQDLAELGGRAEALLYSRPTDLQGAARAVARYEERLSGSKGEV